MANRSRALDYITGSIAVAAFLLLLAENTELGAAYAWPIQNANLAITLIFISDLLLRLLFSSDRKTYLKQNWFTLIVFIPFVQFLLGDAGGTVGFVTRQVVVITMLISRTLKVRKLFALLSLKPAQTMIISFFFAICVGTVLLMLPAATRSGERITLADALFTATSATCVTGLVVHDTGSHFSLFGQFVILSLIQAGGLGIMTFSASLIFLLRKGMDMKQQAALKDVLEHEALANIRRLVLFIISMTIIFELLGAVALSMAWYGRFPNVATTAYHAGFHSISAFCNAGFSTFSDSLMQFNDHIKTNVIIMLLIVFGGIGFAVVNDLSQNFKGKLFHKNAGVFRLRVQTKIVLTVSMLLVVLGALTIYTLERNSAFAGMTPLEKVLNSCFQSVTTRTAGFNTCAIGLLSSATLLFMMALMFIGGSPGSTAGGIKTATIAVLWATVVSELKRRDNVELCKRTIPPEVIRKAMVVLCISLLIVICFAGLLLAYEEKSFLAICFETVSAFGTVGLSTGITSALTTEGKVLITILMFVGRMGPLTVAYALTQSRTPAKYVYPDERVTIG